jgi:thioredoxin-like negative regulator of GroEL
VLQARQPTWADSLPARLRFYMGAVMSGLRGRVPATQIQQALGELLQKADTDQAADTTERDIR